MTTFTLLHVAISLVGILSGVVVMYGLLTADRLDSWTALFLTTTAATGLTGFLFPFHHFLPSHGVGIILLAVLALAVYARYVKRLARIWRSFYVAGAVVALYLNVFVAVVQAFLKIPALRAMAPTQSEPPFQFAQLAVLLVFFVLGIAATLRFRNAPL